MRFARASFRVSELNCRNKALTAKLLKQDCCYHRRFQSFIADTVGWWKNNVRSKKLLQQGISEPAFYGDLVYRIRKIVGKSNFSEQFKKLINHYNRIGYNAIDCMPSC